MYSTSNQSDYTKQEILEIFQDVREEHGNLKQITIKENTDLKRKDIMAYFDSLRNAKFELRLWESNYVTTDIANEIDIDYQSILIKLLEICEKENEKVTTKIIDKDENMPKSSDYRREFESLSIAKFQANLSSDSVINLTDTQLESLEEDMIKLIQKCKKENNHVSLELVRNMSANIKPAHIVRHFGSFSKAKLASLDNPRQIHLTSNELKSLDEKLRKDNYRREIINGLIMGDGYIGNTAEGKNNNIEVETTNETYLKYLEKELGDIVIRVTQSRTKEEIAEKNRKYGYTVNEDKINDEYVISTRNLPIFSELRKKWYSNNGKKSIS